MNASIIGIIAEKVMRLSFDTARALYTHSPQVDFARMGHEPTALFVTLSDMDRSLDPLTNLFLTQALISLGREADAMPSGSLPVPVRMFLDDFGNFHIPNFEQAISVVRSKNIWCTMLCQTTSQLAARYGEEGANTIIGNCDTQLVLAFQDTTSARYFTDRANKPVSALLATPLDRSWLFLRGKPGELVRRYEVADHPCTTWPSRWSVARTHWKSTPRRSTTRRVRPCKTLQLSSDRPEPATAPKFTWGDHVRFLEQPLLPPRCRARVELPQRRGRKDPSMGDRLVLSRPGG
ncbi:MAG: type IV secretory system conjugative DNA transfer family protein [Collinsella sp.]